MNYVLLYSYIVIIYVEVKGIIYIFHKERITTRDVNISINFFTHQLTEANTHETYTHTYMET